MNKCKRCGSDTIKKGTRNGKQRIKCHNGHWDITYPLGGKILMFDIETTPMEVFVWGLFGNKYISHNNIIKDWNILSWSAKWICDSTIMSDIQTPDEAINRDDNRILQGLWQLIDNADIVIAHNGDKFDIKKMNTRFYMNGLNPPSPYQSIDTLKVVKRSFAFSSNRLDHLSQLTLNKGKIETNFDLWKRCLRGDRRALLDMRTYNKEDVRLLEEVYFEVRPWMKSHPQVSWEAGSHCPACGSENLIQNGHYHTMVNRYQSYRCEDCGSFSRKLQSETDSDFRRELMRPLPR